MTTQFRYSRTRLLETAGFTEAAALSVTAVRGRPGSVRELSLSTLSAPFLSGLTGVLMMGAALFVSFHGRSTFSTNYSALRIPRIAMRSGAGTARTARIRPIAHPHSELAVVYASVRQTVDGVSHIHSEPFRRIKTSLATLGTSLSEDIPPYNPATVLSADGPVTAPTDAGAVSSAQIYSPSVVGNIAVRTLKYPLDTAPRKRVTDAMARQFAAAALGSSSGDAAGSDSGAVHPAPTTVSYGRGVDGLGDATPLAAPKPVGTAENVTVMPEIMANKDPRIGQTKHVVTIRNETLLADALATNGFTAKMVADIEGAIHNIFPDTMLPANAHLRLLYCPSREGTMIPCRVSIYRGDAHIVTVALTDSGRYVIALAPPPIKFSDDDTEQINVNALPSLYRSIWETGRKYKLPKSMIERIIAMFAFDTDLTSKVSPDDSIDILETDPKNGSAPPELLYVALKLGPTTYPMYRFRSADGTVDYYDSEGRTGRRFLIRRPVSGGGRVSSPFGWRFHPVFHKRLFHTGVDLAAPTGTPIYAAGNGTVKLDQWVRGYGWLVELQHANGFTTRYAHMSRFAKGLHPGEHENQGQVIGYVGATGDATGPHLHFEIRINGRPMNPLSVKLPRSKSLPQQDLPAFNTMTAQVGALMKKDSDSTTRLASMPSSARPVLD